MGATLSTLDTIAKEVYAPKIREQLDSRAVALKRIEGSSSGVTDEVGGKYVTFPIHTRRNSGIGARNELERLPTPGQQGHEAVRIKLAYLYAGASLTGQAIRLIDKNYQAFQSSMETELEGLTRDLAKDQNRQVWGDGRGTLGTVVSGTGAAGNNVFVLDTVKHVFRDMVIDVYGAAPAVGATPISAGAKILSVDEDTNTVVFAGPAVTAAAGQVLIKEGNLWREWLGFSAMIGDTNPLYGLNPATEPVWKSKIDRSANPRAISEGLFTRMADKIDLQGGDTTVIFTTHGVRREYAALLQQQRQYVNTKEFKGGFSGIGFITDRGEIPVVTDRDAPKGTASFINEKAITRYRDADWDWFDDLGGSGKWKQKPGFDVYEAMMFQYSQLGTDRRNTHGRIENIAEDE